MQDAEPYFLARREIEARDRDERRRRCDQRQPLPERGQVEAPAMRERQRHADQREERARHHMREHPHRRREGKERRRQPVSGEIPTQVIGRHADERDGARDIEASTRPFDPRAVAGSAVTTRLRTGSRSERIRLRTRPGRSSARGRPSRATRSRVRRRAVGRSPRVPASPARTPATRVAQAAEPQASVSPTPRSQTRAVTSFRELIWAKVTLAFSGNIGCVSMRGSELRGVDARKIGHEENGVGIAHADRRRRPERFRRIAVRPDQRDAAACRRLHARAGCPASRGAARPCRRDRTIRPAARRR